MPVKVQSYRYSLNNLLRLPNSAGIDPVRSGLPYCITIVVADGQAGPGRQGSCLLESNQTDPDQLTC